uniref:Uncharacterized protein n=1 Tax=Rhizophora mucronata TaxID=61149 RepID=A0A2P2NTY7_RHIMU
MVWRCWTTC